MELDNKALIQKALDLTREALKTYIENTFKLYYGDKWESILNNGLLQEVEMKSSTSRKGGERLKDLPFYLNSFTSNWQEVFRNKFSNNYPLTLCHTLKYYRNKWAHQPSFNCRETYRIVETCSTLIEELNLNPSQILEVVKLSLDKLFKDIQAGNFSYFNSNFKEKETLVFDLPPFSDDKTSSQVQSKSKQYEDLDTSNTRIGATKSFDEEDKQSQHHMHMHHKSQNYESMGYKVFNDFSNCSDTTTASYVNGGGMMGQQLPLKITNPNQTESRVNFDLNSNGNNPNGNGSSNVGNNYNNFNHNYLNSSSGGFPFQFQQNELTSNNDQMLQFQYYQYIMQQQSKGNDTNSSGNGNFYEYGSSNQGFSNNFR